MEEVIVKRIRDFSQALNVLNSMKFLVDDDRYLIDEEFKSLSIQQMLDYFLSLVDLSSLEIYILKPVIASVAVLPNVNLIAGDRYFVTQGDLFCKIGEWNGGSWNMIETSHGDCFYCFATHNFIVRKADSFEFSTGAQTYSHPNHSGDVTSQGDGQQTITEKAVTLTKMADVGSGAIFYRKSASDGPPEIQDIKTLKSDLGVCTLKPVITITTILPIIDMAKGDRYFITAGGIAYKIAEWSGDEWQLSTPAEGDSFYSYAQRYFIVKTKSGFDIASGTVNLSELISPDVVNEPMTGITDGINMIFSTRSSFVTGSLIVFVNGVNERYFTIETVESIKFDQAPPADSVILAIYKKK